MLEVIRNTHELFWSSTFYLLLYIICMLVLIIWKKQMKSGNAILVGYSLLLIVGVIYNPIFAKLSLKLFFYGTGEYARLFQILPLWYTIAYVLTAVISQMKTKMQYLALILVISVLAITGKTVFQQQWYLPADNIYKINQNALEISDIILEDMNGKQSVAMIQGKEDQYIQGGSFFYGIRQYTSDLILIDEFPEADLYNSWDKDEQLEFLNNNRIYLKTQQRSHESQYVIVKDTEPMIQDMQECGYSILGRSGEYIVMKV